LFFSKFQVISFYFSGNFQTIWLVRKYSSPIINFLQKY